MSRYIDADALIKSIEKRRLVFKDTITVAEALFAQGRVIREEIDNAPTADVVEVVRCKDCKHHPENGGECDRSITHTGRDYVCEMNTYRYINLEFCSYGERRAEE